MENHSGHNIIPASEWRRMVTHLWRLSDQYSGYIFQQPNQKRPYIDPTLK